jgi:hypothetical protein
MQSARKRRRQNTVTAPSDYRAQNLSDSSDSVDMYSASFEDESDDAAVDYAPLESEADIEDDSFEREVELMDMDSMDIEVEHAIQPDEPVGGMPWARTNAELRELGLCVIDNNKILSCLLCREKIVLLTVNDAPRHVRIHRGAGSRKPTITQMLAVIRRHDVHDDNVCSSRVLLDWNANHYRRH